MFRSYDHHQVENILIARVTQLTTDPLFCSIANIIVIVLYLAVLVDMVVVMCITSIQFEDNGEWKLYTEAKASFHPFHLF
jgi:Cdc6-like AAA superfamily ATPase